MYHNGLYQIFVDLRVVFKLVLLKRIAINLKRCKPIMKLLLAKQIYTSY